MQIINQPARIANQLNGKVLSFGELLLRITPDSNGQWLRDNQLPFFIGGAELNVATALALWKVPSMYFTALPQNGMSEQIVEYLEAKNIDLSRVHHQGKRMGLYFLTKGEDLKHDALVYDRAHSAFAELQPAMIDWDTVLDGVSWFHFSAICPAIGPNVAELCLEALQAASRKGIVISVDLNYRAKLWQYGKTPLDVMPELVQYCDVIMGNIWAMELMLGIPVMPDIHNLGQKAVYLQEAKKTSEQVTAQFHKCKAIANTFRFDAAQDIRYYTTLYTGGEFQVSNEYSARHIIDKVGSGDCYMAGLIYGFYNHWSPRQTAEFATAAAFTKLFVNNDATDKSVEEIQKSMIQ